MKNNLWKNERANNKCYAPLSLEKSHLDRPAGSTRSTNFLTNIGTLFPFCHRLSLRLSPAVRWIEWLFRNSSASSRDSSKAIRASFCFSSAVRFSSACIAVIYLRQSERLDL